MAAATRRDHATSVPSSTPGTSSRGISLPVSLGDRVDEASLLGQHQGERATLLTRPARAPDAVHVFVRVGRHVIVDHAWQAYDVEAARRDVGGHQEIDLAAPEGIERLGSLRLLEIAVDVAHIQPRPAPGGAGWRPHACDCRR